MPRLLPNTESKAKASSKRRSTHVPNLNDDLSTAEERRLNRFGSAGWVCGGKQH